MNLTSAAVSAVATFALTLVVTRGLPLYVAGVFFASTSVFTLLTSVGRLGAGSSLVYFLSRCRALGEIHAITSYVRVALRPVVVIGVLSAVALYLTAGEVAGWVAADHRQLATEYLRVLALFLPFASAADVTLGATRGLGTMRPTALIDQIVRPVLQLVLVCGAVLLPAYWAVTWSWGAGYGVSAVLAALWWRKLKWRLELPAAVPGYASRFWRFSMPRSMTNVAQMAMQRLDIVLVAAMAGVGPAAVYTASTRFVVVGQMAQRAVSLAAQPPIAEALARRDLRATKHLYETSTAWLILVTWPFYLFFLVAAAPLLTVFGQQYRNGALILILVSVAMLISTACGDVDIMLVMAGRPSASATNVLLAFVVNLGLDLWLIPLHGATGAAIGWAVAIVVKNAAGLLQVGLRLRLYPWGRTSATSVLCSIPVAVVGVVVTSFGSMGGVTAMATSGVFGFMGYLVLLLFFRKTLRLSELVPSRKMRGSSPQS